MILGCGRSGTSIFGELFEHLARYSYRSEPPFREIMASDAALGPQAFKVPRESEGFPPTPGLSFPLGDLLRKLPEVKVFWMVRHPLDTICSLRVGISRNWGHHPKPPDWRDWLARPLLERCAHHWDYINSTGLDSVSKLAVVVRFEAMIANPGVFADRVCAQVGSSPKTHRVELSRWARRVQDTDNEHFIEAETSRHYSRPDHAVRVGRWRENLTDREVRDVLPIVAGTARRLGYTLPGGS